MLRSLSRILFSFFMIYISSGCEKRERPAVRTYTREENILRYDVSFPFTSLDPAEVRSSGSVLIFPLLYSYLFVPNSDGQLEPDLAEYWKYDSRDYTWTIHLRKNALFHDGKPVTSKDIRYSIERVLKNNRPFLFSLIDGIELLSDSTVSIGLKKDDPGFAEKIWDMEIVPRSDELKVDFYGHPVGSGPFKFTYRKEEKEVFLEANENYFQGRPSFDGIIYRFQQDKEKAWTRILSGETDIVQEISPKNYEMMRQYEERYYFDLHPLMYYTVLLYNTTDPLFSDPRVRRALSHAIDRGYIVKNILKGFGGVAVGPMGIGSPYQNPEVKPIPYDPKTGLALLKEAGWAFDKGGRYLMKDGRRFEFTLLLFEESQVEKNVALYLQICLNDLGIRVRLESMPHKKLKDRYFRNDDFQAVLTEFRGAYRDPEILKQQWSHDPPNCSEAGCFEHPEVTRLIDRVLDEEDLSKQKTYLFQIDALIQSLQPGIFLFHNTAIDVMSRRFDIPLPFSLSLEGIYRLRYASLHSG
ncbi:MAG: ABC transporter substrate-binding protein [Pseudomonadota bacterium]